MLSLKPLHSECYRRQARWFAGERSRLLRKAGIVSKRCVLDLGAGTGEILPELQRRAGGLVIGLDADLEALRFASGSRVGGRAQALPFRDATFDLVFTQMFFLWAVPGDAVLREIRRVLVRGGHLIAAAEPDYGAAIEYPEGEAWIRQWAEKLAVEGADTEIARKLSGLLGRGGFDILDGGVHPVRPHEAGRAGSLFGFSEVEGSGMEREFVFVPYFFFLAVAVRDDF